MTVRHKDSLLDAKDIARFWSNVDKSGECWLWKGPLSKFGYGRLSVSFQGKRALINAHRISYLIATGRLGQRVHVHHTCKQPACVNPSHLQELSPEVHTSLSVTKTHCLRGHPFTGSNVYLFPNGNGLRGCRTCRIQRALAFYYARKAQRIAN